MPHRIFPEGAPGSCNASLEENKENKESGPYRRKRGKNKKESQNEGNQKVPVKGSGRTPEIQGQKELQRSFC